MGTNILDFKFFNLVIRTFCLTLKLETSNKNDIFTKADFLFLPEKYAKLYQFYLKIAIN